MTNYRKGRALELKAEMKAAYDQLTTARKRMDEDEAETRAFLERAWASTHPPGYECKFCTGELATDDDYGEDDDEL